MLIGVVGLAAGLFLTLRDHLELESLADQESALREYGEHHPLQASAIAFAIYVTVTGLSLPGAAILTLVVAWFFGFWRALVLVSFASTTGATLAFLLSRYLFHDAFQARFGDRLVRFNETLEREGAMYLFSLRLIPAVPFFVINVVMGLTQIRVSTFWWVSQIGMLPGTAVFVLAGSTVPDFKTLSERGTSGIIEPPLLIAFALLGLFPIVAKRIFEAVRRPIAE